MTFHTIFQNLVIHSTYCIINFSIFEIRQFQARALVGQSIHLLIIKMYVGGGTAFFYALILPIIIPDDLGPSDSVALRQKKSSATAKLFFCGRCRDRTYDPLLVRQVL